MSGFEQTLAAEREKCRRYDQMLQRVLRRASVSPEPARGRSPSPSVLPLGHALIPRASVSPSRGDSERPHRTPSPQAFDRRPPLLQPSSPPPPAYTFAQQAPARRALRHPVPPPVAPECRPRACRSVSPPRPAEAPRPPHASAELPPQPGRCVSPTRIPAAEAEAALVSPPRMQPAADAAVRLQSPVRKRAVGVQPGVLPETVLLDMAQHVVIKQEQDRRLFDAKHQESRRCVEAEWDAFLQGVRSRASLLLEEGRSSAMLCAWEDGEWRWLLQAWQAGAACIRAVGEAVASAEEMARRNLEEMQSEGRALLQDHLQQLHAACSVQQEGAGEVDALRRLAAAEALALDARSDLRDEEAAERAALGQAFLRSAECLQRMAVLRTAERTARLLIENVQRVAFDTLRRAEHTERSGVCVLQGAVLQAGAAEAYGRQDIVNFESLVRQTLISNFFRCAKLTLSGSAYHRSAARLVHGPEADERHTIYAAFHQGLCAILLHSGLNHDLELAERRAREMIEAQYWEQLHDAGRLYQSTNETVLLYEQAKQVLLREEAAGRHTILNECTAGYRDILGRWDASLGNIVKFKHGCTCVMTDEEAARLALEDEMDAAQRDLYAAFLEKEHWRLCTDLMDECGIEGIELMGVLRELNAYRQTQLERLAELEGEEEVQRLRMMDNEARERAEIYDVHAMFSQRFSMEHAVLMLISTEARERRSIEWHEVALRNAVHQYHNDSLTSIDAGMRGQAQLADTLERERAFSPDPHPTPPQDTRRVAFTQAARSPSAVLAPPPYPQLPPLGAAPPGAMARSVSGASYDGEWQHPQQHVVSEERKLDSLMERLGSVTQRLRDKVSQKADRSVSGGSFAQWSPFRVVQELYEVYDEALFLPELNEAFLTAVHNIVSRGVMSRNDEAAVSHLASMLLHHLSQLNPEDPSIPHGAAKSLNKIYTLLNLLVVNV